MSIWSRQDVEMKCTKSLLASTTGVTNEYAAHFSVDERTSVHGDAEEDFWQPQNVRCDAKRIGM